MMSNTEIHNWSRPGSAYGGFSPKREPYSTPPPHKAQGSLLEKGQKDFKSQRRWMTTPKQCFQATTGFFFQLVGAL